MNSTQHWFYIEPYIHTAMVKPDQVLIYNPINHKHLVFRDKDVFSLVERALLGNNLGILEIGQKELQKFQDFISLTRDSFMIDIIPKMSQSKPLKFITTPVVLSDNGSLSKEKLGKNVLHNLTKITIYLNSICDSSCSLCNKYFKQTICCHSDESNLQIDIGLIKKMLTDARESSLLSVNIVGGDILKYPFIEELISELNQYEFAKTYIFNIKHLMNDTSLLEKITNETKNSVEIQFTSTEDVFYVNNINIKSKPEHILWNFFVQSMHEVNFIDKFVQNHSIKNYKLTPIYNEENINFFEQYIYTNVEDIIDEKVNELEFKRNQLLNNFFFGHLIIFPSGHVYSNISGKSLGKFPDKSLSQLIYEELLYGNNWLMVRRKTHPCSKCLYNSLCQPISNYESAIGKPNLCHVKP